MGERFTFKLDKLLDMRVKNEEESVRLFKDTQREKMVIEEKLDDMRNDYDRYRGIKPGESIVYQKIKRNYMTALNQGIAEKERELEIKDRELEIRRDNLKQRTIERKTVERLKEKKYEAFTKEQDRIERVNNDEFALYAYIRNTERG
ncbi:flagellar export protein FliJ [Clostridium sp. 'White wine YQ']|uniref:flagellar export protein FliJ n=1 Tax=Clostridium sp. 'White wine YQ' TaxID=3027474 RepID=UPI002366BD4F|nr:flagellar export protein FliJ [Clostridium sp. 'White wine YQ']MDD7794599.1 flagellar export protein FliJ [Clostridium sp. 'White wine YQ']